MPRAFLPAAFLAIASCTAPVSIENAPEKSTEDLCRAIEWSNNGIPSGKDAAAAELLRRGLAEKDVAAIYNDDFYVGMPESAARCAVGFSDEQNVTLTARGRSVQHVVGEFPYSWYFYTRNGVVTGVQY